MIRKTLSREIFFAPHWNLFVSSANVKINKKLHKKFFALVLRIFWNRPEAEEENFHWAFSMLEFIS